MIDRKKKPQAKSEISFNLPQPNEFFLINGLRVIFIKKDKLPLVRLNLIINAGSKFDPQNKIGLSYLTSLVMDEGADGMNALELSDEFDMLGSSFNVSTDNDLVNLSLQSLTENFDRSLELFSKVLLKPSFNDDDFLREKKKLITRILQSKDEPNYLADEIFDMVVLGKSNGYSFPVAGYEETVKSISVEEIKSFYKRFFFPSNSNLIVVGNLNQAKLEQLLNKYFSDWNNNQNNIPLLITSVEPNKKIYLYHKEGTVQTEIRVGHLTENRNQKDFFQRYLLNTILGGQFTSRINLNLRERNGYTYGATSRFQYFKDSAFFEVATSVGIENTAKALKEIIFELDNIRNGISESELEFAKSSITKKFPLNFETYRQIASGVAGKILYNLPDDYFDNYISNVNAVSKSEVEEAAKKFIHNDKLSIVLVGDKNLLHQKLDELIIEVVEVNLFGEKI
ncbi:MAG: insulinase family protein [Ignavibacteriaceae bacterium]|nr:insulinase family protein [Ignavibacterium sp.]MCC6254416.1 insulinase family protein [Ignavibacteriaceae bacterium]HMN24672.1 pitrilysin family protein [Ignavibacteriaceae bacterium]HRN27291.1 pitrilysin family protein [Ignavibacteriaceae bacterium]HRP93342.1 pitrilysin family protein [Ignavibacteriaceae bacterium]